MSRFLPRSLLGQMLLSVALALLVAQALSAVLLFRASEQRREAQAINGLAFQLVAEPRFDFRQSDSRFPGDDKRRQWRRLRVERTTHSPLHAGEQRDPRHEEMLRGILIEQGVQPAELVVTTRHMAIDPYVLGRLRDRGFERPPQWAKGEMLVAGLRRQGETEFSIARIPMTQREPRALGTLLMQTLVLYIVLVGLLAFLLRRITRPLGALTRRLDTFAETRALDGQLEPSGPEDTRRLIAAHNAMEARIAALLDEKDVMLGAIGHDLKTPLAALRVRIESVEDDAERGKMAASIEDITRSLDDILSLARVGRSSEPLERTELSALLASVVEEYEDMGEPVDLGTTQRIALRLRATWLRRALRNLVGNALRYGERARIGLHQDGHEAVVTIEDDGPGMPPDTHERAFKPGERLDESTPGSGLGLAIARDVVGLYDGRLWIEQSRFGGACVVVELDRLD